VISSKLPLVSAAVVLVQCTAALGCVEIVSAPHHETSCDPETTTKKDLDYWRKIIGESNLKVYRRIHDKPNEAGN